MPLTPRQQTTKPRSTTTPTRTTKVPPKTLPKTKKAAPAASANSSEEPKDKTITNSNTNSNTNSAPVTSPRMDEAKENVAKAQAAKASVQGEVDALKDQLESMQSEYDVMVKNMEKEGREQSEQRLARAREEINAHLERSMEHSLADMHSRYKQSQQKVGNQQTDILRMNKIFRDVARCLGTNWRSVFEVLTLQLPPQVTDMHMAKIEAQRPFMQAYKALTTWRELVGDKFNMMDLVDALRKCNLHELATATKETMTTEGDSLMQLGRLGGGIAPGVERQISYDEEGNRYEAAPAEESKPQVTPSGTDLEGPLGNRRLLQLARLIGGSWTDLGRELMVPKEELDEVLQNEGMSYQGAFKILWGWRDRNEDAMHQDNVQVLKDALTKTGRSDLIEKAGL